ncbi:glyceraldehyde-3-phosphate dehydrogenase [Cricetulus griseus]|nr:glyceraldehyde-3-phosphate dehydrogenase [Cricetulus griseus]
MINSKQKNVDGLFGKLWHDGHWTALDISSASIGADKAMGQVIPELKGKLTGMAFHVPTPNVSIMDVTCNLEKTVMYDDVKKLMKQALDCLLKGILGYTENQVVFCDFNDNAYSSTFNVAAGIDLIDNFVQLISLYDNKNDYNNRVADLIDYMTPKIRNAQGFMGKGSGLQVNRYPPPHTPHMIYCLDKDQKNMEPTGYGLNPPYSAGSSNQIHYFLVSRFHKWAQKNNQGTHRPYCSLLQPFVLYELSNASPKPSLIWIVFPSHSGYGSTSHLSVCQ